ncbi:MAG: DUF1858 domain-containing protein [Candidatus Diapherotrites archaeon]|nr:DUF1858 domain-containing protein [Candidatus Diapherotrites archaeon]
MNVTKDSNLAEVVQRHPETIPVFMKYGLHCIGCAIASFETVEQGAIAHGIDADKLIKELNEVIEEEG